MINKKLAFSLFTIPAAVMCHESSEWQRRRKEEKEHEIKRRTERLSKEAIDLTPQDGKFAFSGMTPEEIEEKYGFQRVKIRGIIDSKEEIKIRTTYRGEKGFFICNPLYTHVNDKKEPCGIMVNRGFVAEDYAMFTYHHTAATTGYYEGIIYTGDKETKYDWASNSPSLEIWTRAYPAELALGGKLKNKEDANLALLMLVEFDEEHQTVSPAAPTVSDFTDWKNQPGRHNTYQIFWKYATYLNMFANTMFWMYF